MEFWLSHKTLKNEKSLKTNKLIKVLHWFAITNLLLSMMPFKTSQSDWEKNNFVFHWPVKKELKLESKWWVMTLWTQILNVKMRGIFFVPCMIDSYNQTSSNSVKTKVNRNIVHISCHISFWDEVSFLKKTYLSSCSGFPLSAVWPAAKLAH